LHHRKASGDVTIAPVPRNGPAKRRTATAALSAYGDFTNGKNLSGAASVVVTLGIIAACISGSLAFIESWTMLLLMIWMFTESLKLAFIAPAKN
jgi:hypothetical protein